MVKVFERNLIIAVVGVILILTGTAMATMSARAPLLQITRSVPADAELQYRVGGRVVQSLDLRPGTYRITVEEITR